MALQLAARKRIARGQYWRTPEGDIVLVTGRSNNGSYWLGNKVTTGGSMLENIGIPQQDFDTLLTRKEDITCALLYVEQRARAVLQLA